MSDPWDLATGLAGGHGVVHPGDTLWLHQGTYSGAYSSTLTGAPGAPVVVRQYPGDRAVIDGAGTSTETFVVRGDWSEFWDFELTNSNPDRHSFRPDVVVNYASHTKYIDLVIHDGGVAFYTERDEADVEVYGCVIYNNGYQGSDRGHGHAIYIKSDVGPVLARDNVLFDQFGYGVHAYSDVGTGLLNNILIERNVSFNNGTLSSNSTAGNLLVGGQDPADNVQVLANYTFYPPNYDATNAVLGLDTLRNGTVSFGGNYLVGGSPVVDIGAWSYAAVSENTLVGHGIMQMLHQRVAKGTMWLDNLYYRDSTAAAWGFAGDTLPLGQWRKITGLGDSDRVSEIAPSAPEMHVLVNRYDPHRATVVVYNWGGTATGDVDLSPVLRPGDEFVIRNVQALFDSAVVEGTFTGAPVTLPLKGVPPPTPVGFTSSPAPRTGPAFDVFLVTRSGATP